ncbi:S8 family serine peptidase [Leptospira venezuelensis]|uniref:S8 family serine peptidase n=1 Tax=Leptospira venezuelensis TaxID=1958811 RepID=UPI000A36D93A|nr:S8 family serine peptidase [Leptospira venezuelensis]
MKNKILIFLAVFFLASIGYLFAEKEDDSVPIISRLFRPISDVSNKNNTKKDEKKPFRSSQLIVKFRERAGDSVKSYAVDSFQGKVVNNLDESGISQVELREGQSVEEAISEYSAHPDIEYVQPNYIYHASVAPTDTLYSQLWGLNNTGQTIATATYAPTSAPTNNPGTSGDDMRMESAWAITTDCSNTIVAVVDSGVNYNHQDLNDNMWSSNSCVSDKGESLGTCTNGWDYVDKDSNPMDLNGHGTHVAGTIGAEADGTGVVGVCWVAKIMAVRVLDQSGSGDTATIIKGINFAVKNGAKVLNLSLGGPSYDAAMRSAMASAGSKYDALFVVAAGNESSNLSVKNSYPCEYGDANILCVAALDQKFQLASFSNFDTSKTNVDIGAPGTNIRSSWAGLEATSTVPFTSWLTSGGSGTSWVATTCFTIPVLLLATSCNSAFSGIGAGYATYSYSQADVAFPISAAADAVTAVMSLYLDTEAGYDGFNIYANGNSSLYSNSNIISTLSGETNGKLISNLEISAPKCVGSTNCYIGLEFISDQTVNRAGVAFTTFRINTLDVGTTNQYNTINGTSMATPHVTGLAALLRSYNPKFTYKDTITAIIAGGTTVSNLQSITKSGKAANANGAMRNLEAPVDLSVDVP